MQSRVLALTTCLLLGACGSAPADSTPGPAPERSGAQPSSPLPTARASAGRLADWPEFGLDPQRSNASALSTGITPSNLAHLHHLSVSLPGTVDSSPVYLHAVSVAGGVHDAAIVTTTYGKTLAIDANSGRILWRFTPRGFGRWAGSAQITTTSPVSDPERRFVYTASPDGLIHKLALSDGSEARGWPVSVTRDPTHEKLAAALNIDGSYVLAATGGYFGDAPPYQGHLVAIDRASGRVASVFNMLCSNRPRIIVPSSCGSSDSAILSRGGAIVEPGSGQAGSGRAGSGRAGSGRAGSGRAGSGRAGSGRVLIDTGNGPWNGVTDFGDSVIELSFPALRYLQSFTPLDQASLNESDTDLGSSAPALLSPDRVLVGGKDGVLRVLSLSRLDGHRPPPRAGIGGRSARPGLGERSSGAMPGRAARARLGGEVQRLPLPGGGELFTQPAVWHHGGRTGVFVADEHATAAYALVRGRLRLVWQTEAPGTSPLIAGGLLYVYDPTGGGIAVYRPSSSHPIARLPGSSGHWNSPIVVDGHVVEPEGNANDHSLGGRLEIYSAG